MKLLNNTKTLLILIVLVAGILRFWSLTNVPPSLYWDEVSQGYNAYSILKTGKDEHQEMFPLARFIAFGDYKAPVYTYTIVPFMAVLGKTDFAVRFPSAFFGTLTVLFTFFLVRELFYKDKNREYISLLSALLLAISPWHIQLSRIAYEGNVATFFTILGAFLFLLAQRKRMWWLVLSVVSFVIAFYAFNAHRVFIPLFVVLLSCVYWKHLWTHKKEIIIGGIIGILLLLPYLSFFRSPESKLRFAEVNIFTDLDVVKKSNEWIEQSGNNPIAKVIHNRRVLYGLLYVQHYFDFFNPTYLFISGDVNPRFSSRDVGQLYLWQLPLVLSGIYALTRKERKTAILIFGWFLLAPVAAATARETPHALRSETFIPTYEIFSSLGFLLLLSIVGRYRYGKKIFVTGFIGIGVFYLFLFLHNYFVHFPREFSGEFQYGYKEAIQKSQQVQEKYDAIVISNAYGRPYIYTLFYSDIAPQEFWQTGIVKRDIYGFYEVNKAGKYEFRNQLLSESDRGRKVLYIGSEKEMPENLRKIAQVDFVKGDPAFILAEN